MTLSDASILTRCPACDAPLRVTQRTGDRAPYLSCSGRTSHAFDLAAAPRRGTGGRSGYPVHTDASFGDE